MRFDGANWVTVGAAFSAGQAVYISLAFNPYTQKPYVAFSDVGINGRAAVKRFDGTDWVNVGAAGFSAISASYISLAFDLAASQPYVAYGFLKANVMKFAASQQP